MTPADTAVVPDTASPAFGGAGHQTVLILDFGGQYTQLIARRVRENRVYCEIHPFDLPLDEIRRRRPIGLILSGGPQCVLDPGAPSAPAELFALGIPVLGICYGMQVIAHVLGGAVERADRRREYGRAEVSLVSPDDPGGLFAGLAGTETVWMNHGDQVRRMPPGFRATASTDSVPIVAFEDRGRGIFAVQFHPEVSHTVSGGDMLRSFLFEACGARGDWRIASLLEEMVDRVREQVGDGRVICALSGGVDSSVMAALLDRAVGPRATAIFVDNGVMRQDEGAQVVRALEQGLGVAVRVLGEVTAERVALLREADAIFLHELRESGWDGKVSQAFAVLLPVKSVGVMGDFRTYEDVVALRSVDTHDFMTADWSPLPYELLGRAASRIVNEVKGVNRVVYDITSKPPGTIEWE